MTKLDKAIEKLTKKLESLPEYAEVCKLLPPNNRMELQIMEDSSETKFNQYVSYEGFVPEKGVSSPYLVQVCGLSYFESRLSPKEIAERIEEIVVQERENPTKKHRSCNWEGYSEDLRISLRLADLFGGTDEVYPHMRDAAMGSFVLTL
jgi:hypothetical protein